MKTQNIARVLPITGATLLVPLLAMQFTDQVSWGVTDFTIAGIALLCAGLTLELIRQKTPNNKSRIVLTVLALAIVGLIVIELAVGLFGTPFSGS